MSKLLIVEMFYIDGEIDAVGRAEALLQRLYEETEASQQISADLLHLLIQSSQTERNFELVGEEMDEHDAPMDVYFQTRKGRINPRGANQNAMYNVFYKAIFLLV